MTTKKEGALAIIAALIVLFSAMWDPRVSIGTALVALIVFAADRFLRKDVSETGE